MAQSTCPNPQCKGHSFELMSHLPAYSKFKVQMVQCSTCGTVVGVLEFNNTTALIDKLAAALNVQLH